MVKDAIVRRDKQRLRLKQERKEKKRKDKEEDPKRRQRFNEGEEDDEMDKFLGEDNAKCEPAPVFVAATSEEDDEEGPYEEDILDKWLVKLEQHTVEIPRLPYGFSPQ
eukprot:CAMPEP_0170496086 /NCGR_PEP_ID=MMETSP0208-20121228/20010_1 /TAXON_ID=197538 /ORGANISM="Strombidium inclinatum, Strain S3" /LENGTH=107 /DNA_ID=CAMNT_0010772525 /DNA_START=102 /DNA_END=425 /DNA_ORIENTATION=+